MAREENIDAAASVALDDVILPRLQLQIQQEGVGNRLQAIRLLGWTAKALAMRQHPRLGKPLETVLAYLEAASLDLATAEEEGPTPVSPSGQSLFIGCRLETSEESLRLSHSLVCSLTVACSIGQGAFMSE